jgi:hypothetical protein
MKATGSLSITILSLPQPELHSLVCRGYSRGTVQNEQ